IVEMFKQKNLNKLCIVNRSNAGYLGTRTELLIDELTKLEKDVWLMSTCDGLDEQFETDAYNNYVVKVDTSASLTQCGTPKG
ncbi:hypothetical protein PMAYCL1PPCAC_28397, partial [Pristionchus mayeri]